MRLPEERCGNEFAWLTCHIGWSRRYGRLNATVAVDTENASYKEMPGHWVRKRNLHGWLRLHGNQVPH